MMSDPQRIPSLDERLAASVAALSVSEQRVARFFAERRDELAFMSAAEIATTLGVSKPTVIRAAQGLGYAGLPQLKAELREVVRARSPAQRLERTIEELSEDDDAVFDRMIALHLDVFSQARRAIPHETFRRAIDLLLAAPRIVAFGTGPNRALATLFAQRLRRFGRRALAITLRGVDVAEDLMELRADDVLVVIAYDRAVEEVILTFDRAEELGARRILITDELAHALSGRYDVALAAQRVGAGTFPTVVLTVLILEALLFGLASRDSTGVLAATERYGGFVRRLGVI